MIKLLSINEYFQKNDSNLKLMDNIVKRVIYKYGERVKIDRGGDDSTKNTITSFIILKILKDDFIKFLDKLKILTKKQNVVLSYSSINIDSSSIRITIYLKSFYTKRVKPRQFVYHSTTAKNRADILEKGLICSDSSKNWGTGQIYYDPAIFVVNNKKDYMLYYHTFDYDIWQIDTTKCNNKWYIDFNLHNEHDILQTYLMTYEDIPKDAIRLIDKKDMI